MMKESCDDATIEHLYTRRNWSDVPQELLSLIMSNLFCENLNNFKTVCKSWNLTISVPRSLPPPRESPYFDSPCLMFPLQNSYSWKMFHSTCNDFYYLDFPELMDARIRFSKHGWLLMSRDEFTRDESVMFFFNPLTKETIELPPVECYLVTVCFTDPPTSSSCFVFGFGCDGHHTNETRIRLLKFGENDWELHVFNNTQVSVISNCHPLFHNGVYNCVDQSGNLGIFDPQNDETKWKLYENCSNLDFENESWLRQTYIAEVEGQIIGVFVIDYDRKVYVQKLDLEKKVWEEEEVKDLADKCLFVSPSSSFAEVSVSRDMANKIYFNSFHGKSGVVFSLNNGKYESLVGDFASPEALGLKNVEHATWIKPTYAV